MFPTAWSQNIEALCQMLPHPASRKNAPHGWWCIIWQKITQFNLYRLLYVFVLFRWQTASWFVWKFIILLSVENISDQQRLAPGLTLVCSRRGGNLPLTSIWYPGKNVWTCTFVSLYAFMMCCWILHKANFTWPVYYPYQQMHNIYIDNILYIVSTPACFSASTSSSQSLNLVLCWSYKIIKITTQ